MNRSISALLSVFLSIILLISFASCNKAGGTGDGTSDGTTSAEPTGSVTEALTEAPTEKPTETETESQSAPVDDGLYKKLVVLGDSISTGYGLSGYKKGTSNSSIASYSNKVASANKLKYGLNYYNLAVDGYKSYDVIQKINSNVLKLANADLVLITMGGNDIMIPLALEVADVAGISLSSTAEGVRFILGLVEADNEKFEAFKKSFDENLAAITAGLSSLIDAYSENLVSVVSKIKELSPDATIVLQTVYNPIDDEAFLKGELMKFVNDNVVAKYIGMLNDVIKNNAETLGYTVVDTAALFAGQGSKYTNISKMDIHPNAVGHQRIANAIIKAIEK